MRLNLPFLYTKQNEISF